ncbi:hypothetical protein D3C84_674070 [compost metagenome]
MLNHPVVLGVEDMVHGGQANVLVDPAVASDVVRVEQFVVVETSRYRPSGNFVDISQERCASLSIHRYGVVGDIDKELMTGADRERRIDRRSRIAFGETGESAP